MKNIAAKTLGIVDQVEQPTTAPYSHIDWFYYSVLPLFKRLSYSTLHQGSPLQHLTLDGQEEAHGIQY